MDDYTTTTVDVAMGFARMHYDGPMKDRHQDDHDNDTQECPRLSQPVQSQLVRLKKDTGGSQKRSENILKNT